MSKTPTASPASTWWRSVPPAKNSTSSGCGETKSTRMGRLLLEGVCLELGVEDQDQVVVALLHRREEAVAGDGLEGQAGVRRQHDRLGHQLVGVERQLGAVV